ncbi:hypothetical protein J6590_013970 [Homalodisca vitripennis]|nr:hypothetical protein J6590_013970 [Homalodisca vitripennis]
MATSGSSNLLQMFASARFLNSRGRMIAGFRHRGRHRTILDNVRRISPKMVLTRELGLTSGSSREFTYISARSYNSSGQLVVRNRAGVGDGWPYDRGVRSSWWSCKLFLSSHHGPLMEERSKQDRINKMQWLAQESRGLFRFSLRVHNLYSILMTNPRVQY